LKFSEKLALALKRKTHFIASLEQGIQNLVEFTKTELEMNEYPELKNLILQLNTTETKNKIQKLIHLNH
jgi:hypothetical protein